MSKIVAIGDIHGRAIWRKIVDENPDVDKFIFLGDYFDSHEKKYHPARQTFNFKEILKLQKELGEDRVILLLGNHDFHYYDYREKYSGYNQATYFNVHELLVDVLKSGKMKILHIEDGVLYSHAGVSKWWFEELCNVDTLEEINGPEFNTRLLAWNCHVGYSRDGDTISNSPIWIRPNALSKSKLEGYKQVVGHTVVWAEEFDEFVKLGNEEEIYVNDLLPNYYIVVTDGIVEYRKIMFREEIDLEN